MTDWLANISLEYVIAAIAVLFAARLILGRYESRAAKSAAEIAESALIAIALVFLIIRPFIVQAFYIPSGSMIPTLLERDHILVNKFVYRFQEPGHGDIIVFKSPPEATNTQHSLNSAEWNTVVGEVVSPFGDTGEVMVRAKRDYQHGFGRIKDLYVARKNGKHRVMSIERLSPAKTDLIIKFAGVNSAAAADDLTGAELRVSEKDFIKRLMGLPGDVIEVRNVGIDDEGMPYSAVFRNGRRLNEPYLEEKEIYYEMKPFTIPEGMLFVMGDNRNNSNDSHAWGPLDRDRVIGKAMVRFWPLNRLSLVH